jgi:hypothetical protein
MRWKIVLGTLVTAAVTGLALASQGAAKGGGGFNERSIRGVWGLSAAGQVMPPAAPQPTPFSAINRVVFDGAGNCEVVAQVNLAGTPVGPLVAETCEYSVDPDGFGRAVAQFGPDSPVTSPLPIAFVVVEGSRELLVINSAILVAQGVAKRM